MNLSGIHPRMKHYVIATVAGGALLLAACSDAEVPDARREIPPAAGVVHTVRDTLVDAMFEASGIAEPLQRATLATKLMGTVTEVLVKEGDVVRAGQVLVRIDARDLSAKATQLTAALAEAEAVQRDALTQANRMRALYDDSAATRAQLEAAETGLARADAGVRVARAAAAELSAMDSYATVRAPFTGTITARFVDPGAFATPGSPILALEDASQLRVRANVTPEMARGAKRGQRIRVTIENTDASAIIEGVVPRAGNLYVVNALVANRDGTLLPGSAARLALPSGARRVVVIPAAALRMEGDLTGVTIRIGSTDEIRWVRVARQLGDRVQIESGLQVGDQIVIPTPRQQTASTRGS